MSFYFFTGVKKSQAILQIVLFFYWGKKIPDDNPGGYFYRKTILQIVLFFYWGKKIPTDFADRFIFLLG